MTRDHPIKQFHLPLSTFRRLLSLPGQIVFAITGLLGLAHYSRHIVLVRPEKSAELNIAKHSKGQRRSVLDKQLLSEWIEENVPSLLGSFTPSWWLSK